MWFEMHQRNAVPCNGCRACCQNERIILSPEHGDDTSSYDAVPTRKNLDGPIEWMLRHKPNGDCIYLGANGCSIHHRAPWACRQFDCRQWFMSFPEAMQDLLLPDDIDGNVIKAAVERLPPLQSRCR